MTYLNLLFFVGKLNAWNKISHYSRSRSSKRTSLSTVNHRKISSTTFSSNVDHAFSLLTKKRTFKYVISLLVLYHSVLFSVLFIATSNITLVSFYCHPSYRFTDLSFVKCSTNRVALFALLLALLITSFFAMRFAYRRHYNNNLQYNYDYCHYYNDIFIVFINFRFRTVRPLPRWWFFSTHLSCSLCWMTFLYRFRFIHCNFLKVWFTTDAIFLFIV